MSGYIASKPSFLGPKVRVHSSLYIDEVALCLSGDLAGSPYNEECHQRSIVYPAARHQNGEVYDVLICDS